MITCILLSAGESRRFGSAKALASINGNPVISHLQSSLLASALHEIVIVLGYQDEQIRPFILHHKKIKVVYNKYYNLGQTSSFQCGVQNADSSSIGYMLLPVDVPFIKPPTFDYLNTSFLKRNPTILVPAYKGKKGHPPVFNKNLKKEILGLNTDQGINEVIHRHKNSKDTVIADVADEGVTATFNTPEEFLALKTIFFRDKPLAKRNPR